MLKLIYFISVLITLSFSTTSLAQDKIVTFLPPFKDGEIVIEKKGDFDLVEMKPSFIEESENGKYNLFLVAIFSRINKYPTKIPQIMIAFYSNSKECKFPENSDTKAKIILDGKTISLSNKINKQELAKNGVGIANYNELEGDVCNGMYSMSLPKKTFISLANAKQVQIKIGEYKFELKPHNIKAISNVAKLLSPKK